VDGGSDDEVTVRRNSRAFARIELVPESLRDVHTTDLACSIQGTVSALPIVLAPTGMTRLIHHEGELAVARAAAKAEIPYALSTAGTTSIERLRAQSSASLWFQLYVYKDRALATELIGRARRAGYSVLMLTVDVPVNSVRERDVRNGLTFPPALTPSSVLDAALHPNWWWRFITSRAIVFENLGATSLESLLAASQGFDASLTWNDIEWVRSSWNGPLVVKGVLRAEDARRAVDAGATGIVVSNHGGRQLDGTPATVDVLPSIVDAVGDRAEVMLDSGVRRGTDVVKAMALGARACLVGRPYLYGLAAGGEAGVSRMIQMMSSELRTAMALLGVTNVSEIRADHVRLLDREMQAHLKERTLP
jgi:L-lactate dehydrogenase (cytochrome)